MGPFQITTRALMVAYLHPVLDLALEEINRSVFRHSQTARWDLWNEGMHSNVHVSPRLPSPLDCTILSLFARGILPIITSVSLYQVSRAHQAFSHTKITSSSRYDAASPVQLPTSAHGQAALQARPAVVLLPTLALAPLLHTDRRYVHTLYKFISDH